MELFALAAGAWAVGAGWLLPGAAVASALDLGRPGLERLVVGFAIGRVLLAIATLLATSTLGDGFLHAWALSGTAAWLLVRRRDRVLLCSRPSLEAMLLVLVPTLAALLLVHAVVARGGLPDESGALVFFGRDATNDPLVYAAIARRLLETGLPLVHPFIAGTSTATYVQYGTLAGIHGLGVPLLDVVFRVVPAVEAAGLGLTATALVRALGGGARTAALGGVLVVLGGEPGAWLSMLDLLPGVAVQPLDSWALFGPMLLAFNPGAAGLQLVLTAALLLARSGQRSREAITAGLLVAACFETKLFVWAPAWAGLVGLSLLPRPGARAVRIAAVTATVASLPSLLEKSLWAATLRGRDVTGFAACPGCLPRYLWDAALGSHDLSFRLFRSFRFEELLDPGTFGRTLGGSVLMLAVALGARAAALPALRRGGGPAARTAPGPGAVHGWLAITALLGLSASLVFVTRPHYLNGAQFAWVASVGLWPIAALGFERCWRAGRWPALALAMALTLPGTYRALVPMGWRAPVSRIVSADTLAMAEKLRELSEPGDLVLEPSMLENTDFPSPVTWHAGRSVWLSLLSTVQLLPQEELDRRYGELVAIFRADDGGAAREALSRSGASFVLAPSAFPLRWEWEPVLRPLRSGPAGTLYQVRAKAAARERLDRMPPGRDSAGSAMRFPRAE